MFALDPKLKLARLIAGVVSNLEHRHHDDLGSDDGRGIRSVGGTQQQEKGDGSEDTPNETRHLRLYDAAAPVTARHLSRCQCGLGAPPCWLTMRWPLGLVGS
jgi:hypothetical protein